MWAKDGAFPCPEFHRSMIRVTVNIEERIAATLGDTAEVPRNEASQRERNTLAVVPSWLSSHHKEKMRRATMRLTLRTEYNTPINEQSLSNFVKWE